MKWEVIITPNPGFWNLGIKELIRYKDLLFLTIRRDLVAQYKQTILGPLWYIIQPLLTTLAYTFVFSRVAGLSTDGVPPILFYMGGVINWTLFQESLTRTSNTFIEGKKLFAKVYFPRLVHPITIITTATFKFAIQFLLFMGIYLYFVLAKGASFELNKMALLFPALVLINVGLGMGIGLLITSMTAKYRDFAFLVKFGMQLFMYASPVIYPLSMIPADKRSFILLNPMSSVLEAFKYGFLGEGYLTWTGLAYSAGMMLLLLGFGTLVFHKTEKNFIDKV